MRRMNPCVLLLTFAALVLPWVMPSNADACQPTPLRKIRFSDDGDGFPTCLGIETIEGSSEFEGTISVSQCM